jgi:hypothetical protein
MDNDYRSRDLSSGVKAPSVPRPPCAPPVIGAWFSLVSRGGGMADRNLEPAFPRRA